MDYELADEKVLPNPTNNVSTAQVLDPEGILLQIKQGDTLYDQGRYQRAHEIYRKILELATQDCSKLDLNLGILYQKKGQTSLQLANYPRAQQYFKKALKSTDKNDIIGAIRIQILMGKALISGNNHNEALNQFQEVLSIILKSFENKTREIIECYNNIAVIYEEKQNFNEALNYLNKAIQTLQNREDCNPELATSYYLMGRVYKKRRNNEKAHFYTQKSLEIREKLYGLEHPDIASCYETFGYIWRDEGKLSQSLDTFLNVLNLRLNCLGKMHPQVAECYENIGDLYRYFKDFDKALINYKKVIKIINIFGLTNHLRSAYIYISIAYVYYKLEFFILASDYYEKAITIVTEAYGPNHHSLAMAYQTCASVYRKQGKLDKAEIYLEKALEIKLAHFGPNSSEVANSYNELGALYGRKNEFCKSFKSLLKSTKIKSGFGVRSDEAHSYSNLSVLMKKAKDEASREACLKKVHVSLIAKNENQADLRECMLKLENGQRKKDLLSLNNDFCV